MTNEKLGRRQKSKGFFPFHFSFVISHFSFLNLSHLSFVIKKHFSFVICHLSFLPLYPSSLP